MLCQPESKPLTARKATINYLLISRKMTAENSITEDINYTADKRSEHKMTKIQNMSSDKWLCYTKYDFN